MKINVARPYFDEKEQEAVARVIESGWVSQGPKVREFEEAFAEYIGVKYAIATTSCTTALHSALAISGIGPGDEVLVPSLSFIASANTITYCGAKPVFVDVEPSTCNIDVKAIRQYISSKTKAIIVVHQMGLPADLDPIIELSQLNGLTIIEDAACAVGSEYKGKKIGGHGNIACFSLHPRKIITTGEGGMITTNNRDIAEKLRRFRQHGMSISDIERHQAINIMLESYPEIGYNYRMTDIQAAIGIVQLQKLPDILSKRNRIAAKYSKAFSNIPKIRIPQLPAYVTKHNFQSYWIEIAENMSIDRDTLMQKLLDQGISTKRGIMAIHLEPCYVADNRELPITERLTSQTLIIPLYPSMTEEEVQYVISEVGRLLC
jgi:perosamine synthetase